MDVTMVKHLRQRLPDIETFRMRFGDRIRVNVSLKQYTSSRLGGPADVLLTADRIEDLVEMATFLWENEAPFLILGGGSNVLVSDAGVRGAVILNRCRQVKFDPQGHPPTVWAASGANLGVVARQAAARGFRGLEWAAGIPGTIGGAVVGNAGAHGGDMATTLLLAEILHREWLNEPSDGRARDNMEIHRENWTPEVLQYTYRGSRLKGGGFAGPVTLKDVQNAVEATSQPNAIILSATMKLTPASPAEVQAMIDQFTLHRRKTQPPGASMGSMFKNPPGDFAGRLIEAAGLKGKRIGGVGISPLHANFFINYGNGSAAEVWELIELTRKTVADKFGQWLDLEVQLVGEWHWEEMG